MRRFINAKTAIALTTLLGSLALAASCTVDTEGLVFQDGTGGDGGANDGNGNGNGTGSTNGEAGMGGGGTATSTCEHATMGCDGKQVEICAGGEWFPVGDPCPFVCASGLCVGSCDPGSTQCASNLAQQTCSSTGSWGEDEACEFACVGDACGGVCKPGAMQCSEDGTPQRCDDEGQWQDQREEPCPGGLCENGACQTCTPEEAEAGATQCYSATAEQECIDEEWSEPEECDFVCFDGGCTGECKPEATRCANDTSTTHKQTCGTNGQWGAPSACGNKACVEGECVGVCRPGATQCNGSVLQECNDVGQWQNAETCGGDTPVCATVKEQSFCAMCQPESKRCVYQKRQVCNLKGDAWVDMPECPERSPICYLGGCYGPEVCTEFRDPVGCVSESSRWYCDGKTPKSQNCLVTQTCEDGDCTIGRL